MNLQNIALAFCASISLAGCGLMPPEPKQLYAGSERPIEEVASISEGARLFLQVLSIDGQYIVDPIIGGARFTKGIHVLPGEREVEVRYNKVTSFNLYGTSTVEHSTTKIMLNAKAGHSYILFGEPAGNKFRFWFVDKGKGYNQDCMLDENYAKMVFRREAVPGC